MESSLSITGTDRTNPLKAGTPRIKMIKIKLSDFGAAAIGWIFGNRTDVKPMVLRRLRVLSAFLLVQGLITLAGSISLRNINTGLWTVVLVTSMALFISYLFSRTRYYPAAIILAITIPAIALLMAVIFKLSDIYLLATFIWFAPPLLVASLVLTARKTVAVAGCYLVFIVILAFLGSLDYELFIPLIAYILVIAFFVGAVSILREKDRVEMETQLKERQQAETALRESEEKFTKAFRLSPQEICITRIKDGKTLEINDSFTRFSGYTREDIIGRTSSEINIWTKPEDRQKMLDLLKKNGRVRNEEFEFRVKSGEIRTQLFSAEPLIFNGEECIMAVITDITERKRMETALADEATRRRILIEQSRDGIVILDENGKVYEANQRFADMMRYSLEEVRQLHVFDWEFLLPREQLLEMIRTIDEKGDHFETRHRRKDGTTYDVEISTNGAMFAGQKLIFCVCRDITERKRMEKALKESEEKFSIAFHFSPVMMAVSTIKGSVFVEANDAYLRGIGYTREEIIGHPVDTVAQTWINQDEYQRMVKQMHEQHKFINQEFSFKMKSGEIRQWLCSGEITAIGGEPCFINTAIDITERRKMEKALKESEEKFSVAFHSSPDLIAIARSKDRLFIEVNESYLRTTGYTREEIIGHSAEDLNNLWVNPDESQKMAKLLEEKGGYTHEEFSFRMKSGEIRQWLCSGEIVNIGGEPCLMVVGTDITERKQAEEKLKSVMANLEHSSAQLQAANKELESFSYSVSHDLRSPLRSIDGFSQALLEDYPDKLNGKGADYLNRIRNASQKMGELIDGMLKLSRLTRSELRLEKIDLSGLAGEISSRLRETYPDRRAEFIIEGGLSAEADPQMSRILLENLLGNAWKFTRKTELARIEFGSTPDGASKTFYIKDNGAGFDMQYKDKLFGAFQRLHDTADFPGTGIGLATVRRIINRHGGSIRAEGEVGKGATFYFTLNGGV